MDTIFNINRILLILRADWIEYKRTFCITAGLLFLGMLILLFTGKSPNIEQIFWLGMLVPIISYFTHLRRIIHHPKGLFLTLPASTLEKFTAFIISGFLYAVIYFIIFSIIYSVDYFILGNTGKLLPHELFNFNSGGISLMVFITAYLFLAYVWIRKYTVGIAATVLILIIAVSVRIYGAFLSHSLMSGQYGFIKSDAIFDTFRFMADYFQLAMYITSAVLFYVAYLKLKEKEIK